MNNIINEINQRLETILSQNPDSKVKEAMYYSLKAGGKRIRPLIVLQVIRAYGMKYEDYIDIACALEMIHTYSLIHDDLPGMDNDDLRRGKPTCHKQFGEATAILAGDGLLNEAVNIILQTNINSNLKLSLISCLYQSSGISGMILGQEYDIENEGKKLTKETLDKIHHYKTGKLLSCAFQMGALIAAPNDLDILKKIGYQIGLAFQIQDDILDVTSDAQTLGKNVGSDEANHKETYVTLLGIENSQKEVDRLFNEAQQLVYSLTLNHGLILEIIEKLWKRVK
nr:farnesyl diphosphate synthase [uncultured Faecalibacillus sp.]